MWTIFYSFVSAYAFFNCPSHYFYIFFYSRFYCYICYSILCIILTIFVHMPLLHLHFLTDNLMQCLLGFNSCFSGWTFVLWFYSLLILHYRLFSNFTFSWASAVQWDFAFNNILFNYICALFHFFMVTNCC